MRASAPTSLHFLLFAFAALPASAAEAPAPRAVQPTSVLFDSSRDDFGADVHYRMNIYYKLLYGDFFARYREQNSFFRVGGDVPAFDRLNQEAWRVNKKNVSILTCKYRMPAEARHREYYFWFAHAYSTVQPTTLRKENPFHPFLLIGAPRTACPKKESEADAEVRKNFSPGIVFADAAGPQPDLLDPPDDMLSISWRSSADATRSARAFAAGDRAGLPYPLESWNTNEAEKMRLVHMGMLTFARKCQKEHGREGEFWATWAGYDADPGKLPASAKEIVERSIQREDWAASSFGKMAYCDFKVYLQELQRFNDQLMQAGP
jgi:hypothetical protein